MTCANASTLPPAWLRGQSVEAERTREVWLETVETGQQYEQTWRLHMRLYISSTDRIFSRYGVEVVIGVRTVYAAGWGSIGGDPSRGKEPSSSTYSTFQGFRFEGNTIYAFQLNGGGHGRSWEVETDPSHSTCSAKIIEASSRTYHNGIFTDATGKARRVLRTSDDGGTCRIVQGNVFE
jgi:hypothetical protein